MGIVTKIAMEFNYGIKRIRKNSFRQPNSFVKLVQEFSLDWLLIAGGFIFISSNLGNENHYIVKLNIFLLCAHLVLSWIYINSWKEFYGIRTIREKVEELENQIGDYQKLLDKIEKTQASNLNAFNKRILEKLKSIKEKESELGAYYDYFEFGSVEDLRFRNIITKESNDVEKYYLRYILIFHFYHDLSSFKNIEILFVNHLKIIIVIDIVFLILNTF